MCIWVCFPRYKLILDAYKINLNMEDENNYLDEYLTERIQFEKKKTHLIIKKFNYIILSSKIII